MKARKNAAELDGARKAQLRDGVAMVRFLHWFSVHAPGGKLTEIDAAQALETFRRDTQKLKDVSFPSIAAAGANAAIPHYRVTVKTNAKIRKGIFLIDSGGQYEDGTTDITRTIAVGTPTAMMRDRFTRVLKGHIAIARAVFPQGTTGAQIDALARVPLWRAGLDFDHGTGHGVGSYLSVHEGPQRISKLGSAELEPGMILSNEPGYYDAGHWGIRIENLVVVERRAIAGAEREMLGFETITLAPIDLALIEPKLLDREEIAWINAYHARVRRDISPLVEPGRAPLAPCRDARLENSGRINAEKRSFHAVPFRARDDNMWRRGERWADRPSSRWRASCRLRSNVSHRKRLPLGRRGPRGQGIDAVRQDKGRRLSKGRSGHPGRASLFQSGDHRDRYRKRRESLSRLDRFRAPAANRSFHRLRLDIEGRACQKPKTPCLDQKNMPDLQTLRAQILEQIATAQDEAALDAVRVAALGKKGSISALLAGLGTMAPDERKERGAAVNALKDDIAAALAARRAVLKDLALEARLKGETVDVTLPLRPHGIEAGRIHPVSQVMDETRGDFRRHGLCHCRRAGHRERRL